MRLLNGCVSALVLAVVPFISGLAESSGQTDLTPRITKQRVVSCPLKLDTTRLTSHKTLQEYIWNQALGELPYVSMHNNIRHKSDISADQVLTSNGGYFVVNDDQNSVSQLYCDYADANGQYFYLAFNFRSELTFHVRDFLPSALKEKVFDRSGSRDCSAINEANVIEKPNCQVVLANLLVTNDIKAVRVFGFKKNIEQYGYITYKPPFDIPEYSEDPEVYNKSKKDQEIPPGETRAFPVSIDHPHAVTASVRVYQDMISVEKRCIDSWLPKANLLMKYGASPQIIISGEVGFDGNVNQDFKCELRCNEKEGHRDCWDIGFWDKVNWLFIWKARPDVRRAFLISEVSKAYGYESHNETDETLLRKYQSIPYYGQLGLEVGASASEIRKAYRQLTLKYHPDKQPNDEKVKKKAEEKYSAITLANEKLKKLNNIISEETGPCTEGNSDDPDNHREL